MNTGFVRRPGVRLAHWQLFAVCVGVWATTWHAITYQLGHNAPEVGVALRFGLAGAVVLGWCAARGLPLRFGARQHALLALQGAFMYGASYACVYFAEERLPSGLVAVGFSASPLLAGVGARRLFGAPLGARFIAGGLLGLAGVALLFWPEFGRAWSAAGAGAGLNAAANAAAAATLSGIGFTAAAVALSAVGSLAASRNRHHGLPLWPALGFGMGYGALTCGLIAAASGHGLTLPAAPAWWASLAYLALAGSVLTFACYLTLQDRIGAGPSASIGVMTPLLALGVSVALEGFRPDVLSFAGAALAVLGNGLMLLPKAGRTRTLPAEPAATALRPAPAPAAE